MMAAASRLELTHPSGTTAIFVGRDATVEAREELGAWLAGRQVFVVSSAALFELHESRIRSLEELAGEAIRATVPDGEAAKTPRAVEGLWNAMLAAGGTRESVVLGVGGGSVTDVAGFAAATYLRGVDLGLVPTTLLGQVDAAVGGKTAIDLPAAKNSVGAFWHPRLVVADTACLASLAPAELRSGMVEIVKIAVAEDSALLERLERLAAEEPEVWSGRAPTAGSERFERIVRDAVAAKIAVVTSDPAESDRRRVLNLGHTLGHAIEAALGYRGLRHGEAVAYGLLFALRLAVARGGSAELDGRVRDLLGRLEMPDLPPLATADLVRAMRRDKKARRDGLVWVLPVAPGRVEITRPLPVETIEAELGAFLSDPWAPPS